jgi:hypothetical protein
VSGDALRREGQPANPGRKSRITQPDSGRTPDRCSAGRSRGRICVAGNALAGVIPHPASSSPEAGPLYRARWARAGLQIRPCQVRLLGAVPSAPSMPVRANHHSQQAKESRHETSSAHPPRCSGQRRRIASAGAARRSRRPRRPVLLLRRRVLELVHRRPLGCHAEPGRERVRQLHSAPGRRTTPTGRATPPRNGCGRGPTAGRPRSCSPSTTANGMPTTRARRGT